MWVAIALSVAGLVFLFWHDLTPSFSTGDGLIVLCAFAFAAQIVMVGMFPAELDPKPMATLQALACCVAAGLFAFINDRPLPVLPVQTLGAAAFTGLLGTALALIVQTWAQRHTSTTHAALTLCTEPVWGAFAGVALFGEVFTPLAVIGCGLMLAGMLTPNLLGVFRSLGHRAIRTEPVGLPAR
jgi:drug/metabolite transporter (DMT)-like permease